MFIEFTIYPSIKNQEPQVGFNIYRTAKHPRYLIDGNPGMPLSKFDEIIRGTNQYNEYLHECERLQIDIKLWVKE